MLSGLVPIIPRLLLLVAAELIAWLLSRILLLSSVTLLALATSRKPSQR